MESNQVAIASAPGKVILAGEHSVVHGNPALATSIGIRAFVKSRLTKTGYLEIFSQDIDLRYNYTTDDLKQIKIGSSICQLDPVAFIANELLEIGEGKGAYLEIKSEIPIGAGLGSSAAICVATTGSIFQLLNKDLDRENISKIAFLGEKITHGTPSGIDNTISTYGGLIKFHNESFDLLRIPEEISLIILNTNILRVSKDLVEKVRKFKMNNEEICLKIFGAINLVTEDMIKALNVTDLRKIGELMNINQGLLHSINVSHKEIAHLIWETRDLGAIGAKLTGAGGGGCVIAIAEDKAKAKHICKELKKTGREVIETYLTYQGVRVETSFPENRIE